jgi:hypothetical protein
MIHKTASLDCNDMVAGNFEHIQKQETNIIKFEQHIFHVKTCDYGSYVLPRMKYYVNSG